MNPQAPVNAADDHWLTVAYYAFHSWSGKRPFWAGLFTMLAGAPIIYFPFGDTRLANVSVTLATTTGSGSLIIGILLITLGLTLWFQQGVRVFAGVAAILLGLVSLPLSNLGGWFLGLICALVGGSLALAWAPGVPAAQESDPQALAATAAVPAPRETETGYPTETTAHADGGRNSAG
ncbi:DUF6114 domain-containing protein [Streptomyces sp. WAC06614]|uniref:DUF6114 domain-containing protein n=1 Tax=Streptomyces sp. WAC06614 TaxID=2487416 RepID=UPI000F770C3D|nr:DUF6114 domain-containing protein [Streptomyces sp. WAC06614]RSS82890.1 hypothetical protein EF918_05515 [Streptomyces sp. WAC06614]